MSTRSLILRPSATSERPTGVYHHWDGYPEGLGKTLFHLARDRFNGDLEAMLKTLIDDHPAGWSTINGVDWDLEPGFTNHDEQICATCRRKCWQHYKQYYKARGKRLPRGAAQRPGYQVFDHHFIAVEDRRPQCYCHGGRSEEAFEVSLDGDTGGAEFAYLISPETRTMQIFCQYENLKINLGEVYGWTRIAEIDLDGDEIDWESISACNDDEEEVA